ncbi:MarR family transcriptional regulator [Salinimicrobium tongyeongense]|jgi:DNA-binding MarR family transcriptional regulator|uniref:MarR family transcriptional regulator n=3 Tax=Salinimicrobium TaxID=561367 RepID=A0A9X3CU02_9FLAO|nr:MULTISPECIES: MarR family transcriptional regulator [Salinimicrobium]MCX2836654.1 MarR family transcriptional regulator [Salinimicrobium profundisediminis]UZH54474.1 MarR family transcriptional regulator [Salinimicrobium tongyeongense]
MKEKTIDYVLRATWIAIAKMYNEEAGKEGSTMATGFALLSIDPEEGTPSTSLGPKMGMEATSLSRTLRTMEDKGLIKRKKNPVDGRSVLIYLTDFGKEMRDYSKKVVLTFDQAVRNEIPQEDLDKFIEVASKIMDLIATRKIYNES